MIVLGDRVRISQLPTFKAVGNYEIPVTGLRATVEDISCDGFSLKFDEHLEDLDEWDNVGTWSAEDIFGSFFDPAERDSHYLHTLVIGYLFGMLCEHTEQS
jgi:hypothetical protein